LLTQDPTSPPPPWLLQRIEEDHAEHLIRTCLRYGHLEDALDHTLRLVRKATASWARASVTQSSTTWLPYALIDAVLKSTEDNLSPAAQNTRRALQGELTQRITRIQKQSEKSH